MTESKRRLVMGIINCTPDSFYTGSGSMPCREALTALIDRQLEEGADILDFGGCSTRPGSEPVSAEEEWARVKLGLEVAREVCRARNQRP
ncbi:MAG: dihydropteroate synthase, partial [Alistipes sp.]|nr:dihydropteroate synthase [Alistipes sp.]